MDIIVVIGGGASGLIASIFAKTNNNKVIVLERNSMCGKKILATGNGRCNYFNDEFSLKHYNSNNLLELNKIITLENKQKIIQFFDNIGIFPKIKNGYYYPNSNQAISVRDSLLSEAKKKDVIIYNDSYVSSIILKNNKYVINYNNKTLVADKVIIATGSCASPSTGSDGNGYELCKQLKHKIIKPLPALVQLVGKEKYFKDWNGIRSDVKLSLYSNNKLLKEETGEIQLTDYGISGICTFNISSNVSKNLDLGYKQEVSINFLPFLKDDIYKFMEDRNNLLKGRNVYDILIGLLNNKLVNVLLNISNIDKNISYDKLSFDKKKILCRNLVDFRLEIVGTKTFKEAQVCSGGVSLDDVNVETMESKIYSNLYFTGEILDVDGECGGYNLAFAWLSGMIAGNNCRK